MKSDKNVERPRQKVVGVIIFFFVVLALAILEYVAVGLHHGHWIELLNGATWPLQFEKSESHGFWFFVLLAIRTTLNLGITITAGVGLYFFTGPGREALKRLTNIENALAIQNEALAGVILKVLNNNGIKLTETAIDNVYKAVEEYSDNHFTKKIMEASSTEDDSQSEHVAAAAAAPSRSVDR